MHQHTAGQDQVVLQIKWCASVIVHRSVEAMLASSQGEYMFR